MTKTIIHTDGGARGNPGPAAIGVVIDHAGTQHTFGEYIGHATNNQAEYRAVILALEKALQLGAEEIEVYLDSELVQQQLCGNYKVKNQDLGTLFVRVWNLQQKFKAIRYTHIPREQNKAADALVNQVLDSQGS